MLRSFISSLLFLSFIAGHSQNEPIDLQKKDTLSYKQPYGLRLGLDLSRPALSFLNDRYTGLELVADYRLTQNMFLAAELGNEKKSFTEELGPDNNGNNIEIYDYTTSGSYIKLGVDLNTYENWYGMNNSIYIGGRYALSSLSHTVNNFSFYDSNRYWNPNGFVAGATQDQEFSGLNASWLEFIFGMKAELFANIYLGASVRLGFLISNKESEAFPNLWIPGFNKVTDGSNFGVGYNYSLSYLIPLYKKAKKAKQEAAE